MKSARFAITLVSLFILYGSTPSFAQTAPEVVLTWQANTVVPADVLVKALPTTGSQITVAVDVFDNGKTIDLSRAEIRWYANNQFLRSGTGLTSMTFTAAQSASAYVVRATIKGIPSGELTKSIQIPLSEKLIVLDAPLSNSLTADQEFLVTALPFFFTAGQSQLTIAWQINNNPVRNAAKPFTTRVVAGNAQPGDNIIIRATISERGNPLSTAQTSRIFKIK